MCTDHRKRRRHHQSSAGVTKAQSGAPIQTIAGGGSIEKRRGQSACWICVLLGANLGRTRPRSRRGMNRWDILQRTQRDPPRTPVNSHARPQTQVVPRSSPISRGSMAWASAFARYQCHVQERSTTFLQTSPSLAQPLNIAFERCVQ